MSATWVELPNNEPRDNTARRHDIDALRVILFGLLIWFHYVTLCTWVQDPRPFESHRAAVVVVGVMHQWRLAALFVISGMGTAFAFRRRTWQSYLKERCVRLLVPLLFTTYVLLGGFVDLRGTTSRLFEIFPGINRMPYGHLWFVYNLLIYSVVLLPLFSHLRRHPNGHLVRTVRKLLQMPLGSGLVLVPPVVFAFSNMLFKPWMAGEVGMWWEFPRYFLYFMMGYLLITAREQYFAALGFIRIPLVFLTAALTAVYVAGQWVFGVPELDRGGWIQHGYPAFSLGAAAGTFVLELHAWVWCLLLFAWAAKLLNRPSRVISYLNQSVYSSYIVHINVAIISAAIVYRLKLGYDFGLMLGLVIQTLCCLAFFEVARGSGLGRLLFGIKTLGNLKTESRSTGWQAGVSTGFHVLALGVLVLGLMIGATRLMGQHFSQEVANRRGLDRQALTVRP